MRGRVSFNASLRSSSVVVSVSYPTPLTSSIGRTESYWRAAAVEGLANYAGQPAFMFQHLTGHRGKWGLPLLEPVAECADGRWPVVIFSHGLAGCADMYQQLCRAVASLGFIVIAIEHADGSGCYAVTEEGDTKLYTQPDATPYSRSKVTSFRAPFLQHRLSEIKGVLGLLGQGPAGTRAETRTGPDSAVNTSVSNEALAAMIGSGSSAHVTLMGHSFGAATVAYASQRLDARNIGCCVLLDPWAFCLEDATLEKGITYPALSVLSEAWLTNDERPEIDLLLERCGGRAASYYLKGTVHQSFSDTPTW